MALRLSGLPWRRPDKARCATIRQRHRTLRLAFMNKIGELKRAKPRFPRDGEPASGIPALPWIDSEQLVSREQFKNNELSPCPFMD